MIFMELQVAKNGLSSHSSVFYQATLEDSQLRINMLTLESFQRIFKL
jgi:hypothetical protein